MAELLQIVGECAYVTQETAAGRAKMLLMKGAVVSADVPEAKHLLSAGLATRVGDDAVPGLDATGEPVLDPDAAGTGKAATDQVKVEAKSDDDPEAKAAAEAAAEAAELEARREAARAKLPADGSAPHHNAGHEVWVEHAVRKGMDRTEAEKASKDDLKAALKS